MHQLIKHLHALNERGEAYSAEVTLTTNQVIVGDVIDIDFSTIYLDTKDYASSGHNAPLPYLAGRKEHRIFIAMTHVVAVRVVELG